MMPLVKSPRRSSSVTTAPHVPANSRPRSSTFTSQGSSQFPSPSTRSSVSISLESTLPVAPQPSAREAHRIGTLVAVVLKARHLPDKHVCSKQSPYTRVAFSGQSHHTRTDARGGQHPEWDEELRFPVYSDDTEKMNRVMEISIWAKEKPGADELVGEATLDISPILKRGEFDEWIPLRRNEFQRGEVFLELTYFSARSPSITTYPSYYGNRCPSSVTLSEPVAPVGPVASDLPASVAASMTSVISLSVFPRAVPPLPPPKCETPPPIPPKPIGRNNMNFIPGAFENDDVAGTPTHSEIMIQPASRTSWVASIGNQFSYLLSGRQSTPEEKEEIAPIVPGGFVE